MQNANRSATKTVMIAAAIAAAIAGLFAVDHTLSTAAAARPATATPPAAPLAIATGDSRASDYRLERDSCCAGSQ